MIAADISNHGELIRQIADLKTEWDAAQPLTPENEHRLWQKLRLEWNYHSNHIEGNTLTYGETELLIVQGRTTGQHELREYEEMKAHDVGIHHIRELADDERPITEADIRDLNRIILKEPFWKDATTPDGKPTQKRIIPGQYKSTPNNVRTKTGEVFQFSSPEDTPAQMAELAEWFRCGVEDCSTELVSFLATFHHRFSIIHPFDDGNGRTMRLLMNYALIRRGYVPIVIRTESKAEYLGALGAADAGDVGPFVTFLGNHFADALNLGLRASRGESIEEPEDWQKEMKLFVRDLAVEGDPAPPHSFELLKTWMEKAILPLTEAVLSKLSPVRKLFHRCACVIDGLDVHGNSQFADWTPESADHLKNVSRRAAEHYPISHRLLRGQKLSFEFRLTGFSNPRVYPFDVVSSLTLDLAQYRYSISAGGLSVPIISLRYDRKLDPTLVESVSSQIAKFLFQQVKDLAQSNAHA